MKEKLKVCKTKIFYSLMCNEICTFCLFKVKIKFLKHSIVSIIIFHKIYCFHSKETWNIYSKTICNFLHKVKCFFTVPRRKTYVGSAERNRIHLFLFNIFKIIVSSTWSNKRNRKEWKGNFIKQSCITLYFVKKNYANFIIIIGVLMHIQDNIVRYIL